jgi:ADP-ribose pyrophosphatase
MVNPPKVGNGDEASKVRNMETTRTQTPHVELVEEEIVHENPWWVIHFDKVVFPNGKEGNHLRLHTTTGKAGAVVLPYRNLNGMGVEVALVSLYRYPISNYITELPRGFANIEDVNGAETALRELFEETGLTPVKVTNLGTVKPDGGLIDIDVNLVAVEVAPGQGGPFDEEVDTLHWVSYQELWDLIKDGTIDDGFTLSCCTRALLHGILPPPGI